MEFRKDIGGLRAYAVVAVVLYHFGVPGFQGGFVGVDVFFVISGFLMTRMILPRLDGGGFSLKGFYHARARRIIPALAVLCGLVMGVGWWQLGPSEYGLVGKHAAASIAFVSNIVYWGESGYFDASSHEKWLLHTWSLSVEWQFYLIFPLFLIGLSRMFRARDRYLWATCLALVASLVVSVVCTRLWPNASFYLLPTRAWEMLAGTLVYLVQDGRPQPGPRTAQILEGAGVLMIAGAVLGFDASVPWPGYWAVIPVLGASFVLMAMRSESIWTGTAPAQALGAWSYSIYLWHWPVQVALSRLEERGWIMVAGAILLSTVLGYASYVLVESPMRRMGKAPRGLLHFGALVAVMAGIGLMISRTDGFLQARFGDSPRHAELLHMLSFLHYDRASYREGECFLRPNQDERSFGDRCIARKSSSGAYFGDRDRAFRSIVTGGFGGT
jgi:peptidoglycan/LPS O-acetylase OafA/YrhL